jgi:hypothetical protein
VNYFKRVLMGGGAAVLLSLASAWFWHGVTVGSFAAMLVTFGLVAILIGMSYIKVDACCGIENDVI